MTATCPVCGCEQGAGLLCASDTGRLERDLGDVASIVADLDITMSRQDKVPSSGGAPSSPKGKEDDAGLSAIAHTRTPINFGAVQAADNLGNVLTTWARDVADWVPSTRIWVSSAPAARVAATVLIRHIDAIRRHPAVKELADEITDAIAQARRVVDRPADRKFVGPCLVEYEGVTCEEDIYARLGSEWAVCRVCGANHEVAGRRKWLMAEAEDRLFTVVESSQLMGDMFGIRVTEASIRGYLHRKRLVYHTANLIRLGDLLTLVVKETERRSA